MMTAIVFIVTLGILIFVHELGHFVVARRNGIAADEFGFGFPPRIFGIQRRSDGTWRWVWGGKNPAPSAQENQPEPTIYSLNWIPLGGFVRIKGEEGGHANDVDSFAAKPAWTRIKVLGAGVTMNFILAWAVISLAFWVGAPQEVEQARVGGDVVNRKIQISTVVVGSPAEIMGLKIGDTVIRCIEDADPACAKPFVTVAALQQFIQSRKGTPIHLEIQRGAGQLEVTGTPRVTFPSTEGSLGVGLVETAIIRYPWYQAIVEGLLSMLNLTGMILVSFGEMLKHLIFGEKLGVEVTGPVGIVFFTKQVTELGFVYILQFIALLSINLGIVNALPIPALDGGRILFILIEKFRGKPISHKVEHAIHTVGFMALISLMIFITARDFMRFDIVEKLRALFS